MLKKISIIILIIVLLGAGIVSYFLFFKKKTGTVDSPGFSLGDIFPFIDNSVNPGDSNNPDPIIDNPIVGEPGEPSKPPKLFMISKGPVSGAFTFDVDREIPQDPKKLDKDGKPLPVETEQATKIRFTESATGHTNESYLDIVDIKKITNTTIPKVVESFFAGKAGTYSLLRYADEKNSIQTFSGNIPLLPEKNGAPDTTLRGSYLPENITSISISPDREKIFTIVSSSSGSVGSTSIPDGTKRNQILSIAYSEWLSEWPNSKFVTITTKPSYKFPGYTYTIDVSTKEMKKVFGGIPGLTTLTSPDMENIIFSRSVNNSISSNIYNVKSRESISLPGATTLPEKCVWYSKIVLYCAVPTYFPEGNYPDAWYMGAVSFADQIYKINIDTFESSVIGTPSAVGAVIDVTNLTINPSGTFLTFINKRDGSLWGLDLRPEGVQ